MVLGNPLRPVSRSVAGDRWALPALTVGVCLFLGWSSLHSGWVPHDMGQLGQTAERVLQGEVQHRDFDEPYTGGLGYLHSLSFRLWGVHAESMRWTLLFYYGLFCAVVYALCRRIMLPSVAALLTLLCAALSIPVYSESVPSWYNLFFATFGLACLLEFHRTKARRWLIWVGCCAGCSVVMKITGLYFVAAVLACLAHYEQVESAACEGSDRSRGYRAFVYSLYALFALCGLAFVRHDFAWRYFVHFGVPIVGTASFLAWHEGRTGRGHFLPRLSRLLGLVVPFAMGLLATLLLFATPYLLTDSLGWLYRGLFVLPAARLQHAALPPPSLIWVGWSFVLALPLCAGFVGLSSWGPVANTERGSIVLRALRSSRAASARQCASRCGLLVWIAALVVLWAASAMAPVYFVLFQVTRNLAPCVFLVGLFLYIRSPKVSESQVAFYVLVVAGMASLIQYPYAYGTYFFYAAPLVVLAIVYLLAERGRVVPWFHAGLLAFFVAFCLLRLPQPDPRLTNGFCRPDLPVQRAGLARSDLRVYKPDARVYQRLVRLIARHTSEGEPIYAGPDCPEVYFLADRPNPTRTMYEVFNSESESRTNRLIELIEGHSLRVAVIHHRPAFSEPVDDRLLSYLREHFPFHKEIDRSGIYGKERPLKFTVFWSDSSTLPEPDRRAASR